MEELLDPMPTPQTTQTNEAVALNENEKLLDGAPEISQVFDGKTMEPLETKKPLQSHNSETAKTPKTWQMNIRWEELVDEKTEEHEPAEYYSTVGAGGGGPSTLAQGLTTGIEQKLSFRMFRSQKQVQDIADIYDMGKKLGEGAFGTVYEATHIQANKACAIKIISKRKLMQHQIYVNLMDQELDALDKLEHPHIVHVLDLLQDDDNYYIVLELMLHGTLRQKLGKI